MTVTAAPSVNNHVGNGVTTVFAFGFKILQASDLKVTVDGIVVTNYTVSGVRNPAGGTITFSVAPANLAAIRIARNMAISRSTDYQFNGALPSDTLNDDQDAPIMMVQQVDEKVGRALKAPESDTITLADLPAASARANLLLGFDSNGQPIAAAPVAGSASALATTLASSLGSTLIGFIGFGTGIIARTVSAVLLDLPINVKNYGALGNDSNDDTAAIQAAINYAATFPNGRVVEFPPGTYRSNTITVPNNVSLTLRGHGDATKIRRISGSGYIFNCGSASIFSTRLKIEGIFFQGPVAGTSNGIRLNNCNTAVVERCVFQNQVTGIESQNSFAIEVVSNVFDVCTSYGFIATTACHNAVIERNNFFTCGLQGVRFDVLSDNLRIDGNNFEYCGSNIRLQSCTAVSIEDNYMEYQANACFEFLGTCRQVYIQGNWIALGSGGGAIAALANIVGGYFRHNTIFNQTVTTAASLVDFEIGDNYKSGTGTMAVQNWIAPALLNAWVNQANYVPVTYRKDADNVVHIRGNATTGAAGTIIFNLPAGYRPGAFCTFGTYGTGGASPVEVRLNGDVVVVLAPGNQCGLNGISFKAEA